MALCTRLKWPTPVGFLQQASMSLWLIQRHENRPLSLTLPLDGGGMGRGELLPIRYSLLAVKGWLRPEDLSENPGPRGRVGLAHDVLNVFLDRLFRNLQRVGNFFVRPSLRQVLHNGLFAIR